MRFIPLPVLVLMSMCSFLGAETVINDPPAPGTTDWKSLLGMVLMGIVTAFLLPFLRQKAAAAQAEAQLHVINASSSLIDQRGAIMERLKSYLWGRAAAIAEGEFPNLCRDIIAGKFNSVVAIKLQLQQWGQVLKVDAISYFRTQGVDIVATFGVQALDDLIERAANAASPFPGKETAVALLEENIAPLLISKGVEWMKSNHAWLGDPPQQIPADLVPAKP